MFDNTTDPTDPAYFEVTRRLEAFADLRLSPSASATTRMRTNVMTAAHRRAALTEGDATIGAADASVSAVVVAAVSARKVQAVRLGWRRPVAAAFAGCLTLGILAGTASAAKPGGPLYGARMWTEMATLPAGVAARAQAEVTRLEERLAEAQEAFTASDIDGAQAALVAYTQILAEAANASDGDPAAMAAIEQSVTRHLAVLTLLAETVPPTARDALERALSSSAKVLSDLGAPGSDGRHLGDGNGNGTVGGDPGHVTNPGQTTGGAAATSKPTPTPDPTATPKPTGSPAQSPKPDKSPKPEQVDPSPHATDALAPNDAHGSSSSPGQQVAP